MDIRYHKWRILICCLGVLGACFFVSLKSRGLKYYTLSLQEVTSAEYTFLPLAPDAVTLPELLQDKTVQSEILTSTTINPRISESDTNVKIKQSQELRLKRVKQKCDNNPSLKSQNFSNLNLRTVKNFLPQLYEDENNKVVYCFIPKAASHSVRAYILNNTKRMNIDSKATVSPWRGGKLEDIGIKQLYLNKTIQDIETRLKTYFTFLFVRHPLDRLVSAYTDKFLGAEVGYAKSKALYVKKLLRDKKDINMTRNGWQTDRVTFTEFIKIVINKSLEDWHWKTFQQLAHPCVVPYDFIGKVETFPEDSKYIIKNKLSGIGISNLPSMHGSRQQDAVKRTNTSGYRRHLPEFRQISEEQFQAVVDLFHIDMEMFGYTYERDPKSGEVVATCKEKDCY